MGSRIGVVRDTRILKATQRSTEKAAVRTKMNSILPRSCYSVSLLTKSGLNAYYAVSRRNLMTKTKSDTLASFRVAAYEEWAERLCSFPSKPNDQETVIPTSEALKLCICFQIYLAPVYTITNEHGARSIRQPQVALYC